MDNTNDTRKAPTLKTIAFMTGLGLTTVSKALKDAPDISERTKERVRLVARQIGYRPNRAGVRLRTGKTNVISLILNTEEEIMGLTSHIIHGISDVLAETQYHLIVTPYSHRVDPMTPVRYVVETGSADGVILSRTEPDDPRVRYLTENRMPFVTHGRTDMGITHAYHDFDNEQFGLDAVGILARRGCATASLLGPPQNLNYAHHMSNGFVAGILRHGMEMIAFEQANVDDSVAEIADATARLMASSNPPDGIVCASAGAAIGAAAGIERTGRVIGTDVEVVSKQSSVDLLKWFRPAIHVIDEDFREAGAGLARKVIDRIAGVPASQLQTVVYERASEHARLQG